MTQTVWISVRCRSTSLWDSARAGRCVQFTGIGSLQKLRGQLPTRPVHLPVSRDSREIEQNAVLRPFRPLFFFPPLVLPAHPLRLSCTPSYSIDHCALLSRGLAAISIVDRLQRRILGPNNWNWRSAAPAAPACYVPKLGDEDDRAYGVLSCLPSRKRLTAVPFRPGRQNIVDAYFRDSECKL